MGESIEYTPERAKELKDNIEAVQREIQDAQSSSCRLVPISKLKPASDIKALYDVGYRHFGENYIQEMADKARVLPADILWHFVGSLQSNKAKLVASVPNLHIFETLSSIKMADLLQKSLTGRTTPLNVYLQVNTSGEDAKSGLPPLTASSTSGELLDLAKHVLLSCPSLKLLGLMTIGAWESSHNAAGPNPDFTTLKETRRQLVRLLQGGLCETPKVEDLELSMGMSADFVQAVKEGSDSVRVGTRIFGQRPSR